MFLAMRGDKRIAEGENLDQVVIAAEAYCKPQCSGGNIVVWGDGYIVAEIEDQGDDERTLRSYTGRENKH